MTINKLVNTFIKGDCIKVMQSLPDKSVDLVVTSPPYNMGNSSAGSKWKSSKLLNDSYASYSDNLSYNEYVQWQRNCLSEMLRLIKDDGAIFYNHKWRIQKGVLLDRREIVEGFPVRQIVIWNRGSGFNFNRSFFVPSYEVIYIIAKPKFKLVPKSNHHTDVWNILPARNNPHPAPFPVELAERIIASTYAKVVLDPFMGSGTTAIAANRLGRDFIGIDLSEEYCELAQERLLHDQENRGTDSERNSGIRS